MTVATFIYVYVEDCVIISLSLSLSLSAENQIEYVLKLVEHTLDIEKSKV